MKTLIIDTSSQSCLIAIQQGGRLLASFCELHSNQLATLLVPTIERLLAEANLTLSMIEQIACGIGPGSYTGTRVGASVAKALSFALQIPFQPFCSLLLYLKPKEGSFACLMPSKAGGFYLLGGSCEKNHLICSDSSLIEIEPLLEKLKGVKTITGHPIGELQQKISGVSWVAPEPNFEAITLFLNTPKEKRGKPHSDETSLIYLHQP